MVPLISIVGKSNSGKTTFIENFIPVLKARGFKVGVIKHAHQNFEIEKKKKDSWRHKKAGANMVMISSPGKIALIKDEETEKLDNLIKYFSDMDIILCEGYKRENKPKIEIFRKEAHKEPLCQNDKSLFAFVTNSDIKLDVPCFGLNEITKVADLIEKKLSCSHFTSISL